MSTTLSGKCPVCSHVLRLPADATGKKVQCRGCGSTLGIGDGSGDRYELMLVRRGDGAGASVRVANDEPADEAAPAPATAAAPADAQCPQCGGGIAAGDAFCGGCGADLVAARKAAYREETARKHNRRTKSAWRKRRLRATGWLLVLAVLFVIGTIWKGLQMQEDVRATRRELAEYADTEMLVLDGEAITAGELRQQIDLEVALWWGEGLGLAAIMAGLYVWAKRSPFPAILTGLCTFLALIVLEVLIEPAAIVRGLLVKVLATTGLLAGLKAALAERAAAAQRPRRAR